MAGYFIDPDALPGKDLAPGVQLRVTWGQHLMLSFVRLDAGSKVPPHSHPHEQGGVCLEGSMEFTIGSETRVVHRGEGWMIPGGVTHSVLALENGAVALDIFYPHREDYK
jgi:quercetin dioxygenase-like cupin family protein